jgi:predicted RNase H-like HicB family nuclease
MATKKQYKKLSYYLALPWTYTIEQAKDENNNKIYIVRVNELPGICTDAPSVEEAMKLIQEPITAAIEFYMEHNQEIPEPINEEDFKGNISYRTTSRRHYLISKEAQRRDLSLSQLIDNLVDSVLSHRR